MFYNDFFDILNGKNIVIQLYMVSKTELVVQDFLNKTKYISSYNVCIHKQAFRYSIIKFLFNYRNEMLLKKMINAKIKNDVLAVIYGIKKMMGKVGSESCNSKLKVAERNALSEDLYILDHLSYNVDEKNKDIFFQYEPAFVGFNKLLKERNKLTFMFQKSKKNIEKFDTEEQREIVVTKTS